MTVNFEQAGIKIEKEAEFSALRQSIARLLAPGQVEKFLSKLQGKDIRVREFEAVLAKSIPDQLDAELKKSGKGAEQLYRDLPVTDQGQIREFYLSSIEQVSTELRQKYKKIYQYY